MYFEINLKNVPFCCVMSNLSTNGNKNLMLQIHVKLNFIIIKM